MTEDLLKLIKAQDDLIKMLKERIETQEEIIALQKIEMQLNEKLFLTPNLN